jgi:hypothetical protein
MSCGDPLFIESRSGLYALVAFAFITYYPFDNLADMESDVPVPGPVINPPLLFILLASPTVCFAVIAYQNSACS